MARPNLYETTAEAYLQDHALGEEVFGPLGLVVRVRDPEEMAALARGFEGQLTATIHMEDADLAAAQALLPILERKAGRVLVNGFPTRWWKRFELGPWTARSYPIASRTHWRTMRLPRLSTLDCERCSTSGTAPFRGSVDREERQARRKDSRTVANRWSCA